MEGSSEMIAISASDIRENLSMTECIAVMENLFLREGGAISSQPLRTLVRVDPESVILSMPSLSRNLKRFAVKIVTEFKSNPDKFGIAAQGGLIVLIDSEDSRVLAVLDAPTVTAVRTGAVSGLATRILAREDSRKVVVVGSGQQARTQLEAVCAVRPISTVKVFSRDYSHAERFARDMSAELGLLVIPFRDRHEASKGADIAIIATNSEVPAFEWADVPPGCHINSVGVLPERRELDDETIEGSKLFVDIREGVLKEAGDVMHAIEVGRIGENHIVGDLSDLAAGRIGGRTSDDDVTLFKSTGFALQDVYASSFVYDKLSRDEAATKRRFWADLAGT